MASFKSTAKHLLEAIDQCKLHKLINLVANGHDIHVQNSLRQNLLVYIIQQQSTFSTLAKKRFRIFRYLILNYNLNIHSLDHFNKNLFNWITNLNCTDEALFLLESSPGDIDILLRDQTGSCSLHYAVEHGNESLVHAIVNYLVRYRLRFDIKDAHNNTPEDLARKLGYGKLAQFLEQACRSTIFFSREILLQQQPQQTVTNKSRVITMASSSSSSSSFSFSDSSDYFSSVETRINAAKNLGDWKTVAALRTKKRNMISSTIVDPLPSPDERIPSMTSLPKLSSYNSLSQSTGQAEQMLRIMETHMSPSFRRAFLPVYQRTNIPDVIIPRPSVAQRKMSQASTHRRHRDSVVSQLSSSASQEVQSRFSIPPVFKQHRQSILSTN